MFCVVWVGFLLVFVVFPGLLGLFREVSGFFSYGVLPAYLVWTEGYDVGVIRERLDDCGVEWVLSSVMPDELLDRDTYLRFLDLACGLGVEWVLVWDLPTYLERREEGWRNIDRCIELVEFFEGKGFRVIPLVKGAYEDQVRYCVGRFRELGFDFVAFRATDYMRSLFPPYPELPDESSDPKYLLMKYLGVVFEEGVNKILLLGGMNPRYVSEFREISGDIVFSGASWYLDSRRYTIHIPWDKRFVGNRFYECSCPICRYVPARLRRRPDHIALHNLYLDLVMCSDLDEPVIKFYDVILDDFEDAVIAANLFVGSEYSLWRRLLEEVARLSPSYLILAGNVISPENSGWARDEWKAFIEELNSLKNEDGVQTIFMRGVSEIKPVPIHKNYSLLFKLGEDPLTSKSGDENYVLSLIKYYATAKLRLTILKKRVDRSDLKIYIEASSIDDIQPPENYIDTYSSVRERKGFDWLITTVKPYPVIDYEKRVAIPGEWMEKSPYFEQPRPGYLHITKYGGIKLIEMGEN